MDMRVVLEFLIPGMKHAEEPDVGAEAFRITRDLDERSGARAEQKIVDDPLVLQCQRGELVRQREHDMCVGDRQQVTRAGLNPAIARIGLAPRAMPVTARVVRDGPVTAGCALINMSTKRSRAAALNGGQHFQMQAVEPVPVVLDELPSCDSNEIGHLERWPGHYFFGLPDAACKLSSGLAVSLRCFLERWR